MLFRSVNPFNENHKERLVLLDGKKKRVIKMSLLDRKGRFTYKKSENDPHLKQVGSNILLTSRLETSPHTRFVLFDYESGTVLSNWVEKVQFKHAKENKSIGIGLPIAGEPSLITVRTDRPMW